MKASSPQDLPRLIVEGLNSGDVDSVVSLYEPTGIIAPDPNQAVVGHAAIRSLTANFVSLGPRLVLHDSESVQTGDVALVCSRVTLTTIDAQGKKTETHLKPILVVRRQSDGCWLVIIDRPVVVE